MLVKCFGGCTAAQVAGALDLTLRDLMPDSGDGSPPKKANAPGQGGRKAKPSNLSAKAYTTASEAVMALERRHGPKSAWWVYHDAAGAEVGVVVRWDLPAAADDNEAKPRKRILPVSRTATGWVHAGMPSPRPLYGLLALLALPTASQVCVTEGEKAADAARSVGFVATTSPQGAESAGRADWSPLAGHDVVLFPDNDPAGEKYAAHVVELSLKAGARSVKIVRLPDLPEHGDFADFLSLRGGEMEAIRAEVEALVQATEVADAPPAPVAALTYRPFPTGDLPEPVAAFVREAARVMRCDPALIALPLLAGLASAIGNSRCIELRPGWSEPAVLWTVIVARSGSIKSPALDLALGPVSRRQEEAMRRHADEMVRYRADKLSYERELAAWKRSKGGTPPAEPTEPKAERCIVDDCTIEALAARLSENPRGLLAARDELAAWFGSFNEYKGGRGGDAPKWLSMHGARPLIVDRKGSATIYIPRASVSITGTIQPGPMRRAMSMEHRESGMMARLLLAAPPEHPKRWDKTGIDPASARAIERLFADLYTMEPGFDADGRECPRAVRLSPLAERMWGDFYEAHDAERQALPDDLAAAWAKLEGGTARLALIVHMVRVASGETGIDPDTIDGASMLAGIGLAEWFGYEARRVYAMFAESDEDAERRRLLEWIDRRGGSVTARELSKGLWQYRGNSARATAALEDLVKAGRGSWVYPPSGGKGGRPAARFQSATGIPITETPPRDPATGGIGDGDGGEGGKRC